MWLSLITLSFLFVEATSHIDEPQGVAGACHLGDGASLLQTHRSAPLAEPTPNDSGTLGGTKSVMEFLHALTQDEQGQPNPRVSCTKGNTYAREGLAEHLSSLGLTPLGSSGTGNFLYSLQGLETDFCPDGVADVVGYVEGSDPELKGEFVLYAAHYDGPNNQNSGSYPVLDLDDPADIQAADGNMDTDNAYDNAGAVALGMALAEALVKQPAKRSVIFLFTDGEEGADNLGVPALGLNKRQLPPAFAEACVEATGSSNCGQFAIGSSGWVVHSGFDLKQLKFAFAADPLGAAGLGGSDFMALIGTEAAKGSQELLTAAWPQDLDISPVWVNRKAVVGSYSDVDQFTSYGYGAQDFLTNFPDGGYIPYVWVAQPGFQKYHGGLDAYFVDSFPDFKAQADDVMWALDRYCVINTDALQKAYTTVSSLLRHVADAEATSNLKYSYDYSDSLTYSVQDAANVKAGFDFLSTGLARGHNVTGIPDKISNQLIRTMTVGAQMAGAVAMNEAKQYPPGTDLADMTFNDPQFAQGAPLLTAIAIGMDFFKDQNEKALSEFSEAVPSDLPRPCPRR